MKDTVQRNHKKRLGFTLLEITIATVIAGVIASFAITAMPKVIEKEKSKAGERVLIDLYAAQNRHHFNEGSYSSDISKLDTSYANPNGFTLAVSNDPKNLASVTRNSGNPYELIIGETGEIVCDGTYCDNLAYNTGNAGNVEPPEDPPTNIDPPEEESLTFEEVMTLYEKDRKVLIEWIERNPEEWAALLKAYPDLRKLFG